MEPINHPPGNLPFSATEAEILKFLGLSLKEASVELIANRGNPHRKLGFGFVTVPLEKVESSLERNGAVLGGRHIKGEAVSLLGSRYQRYAGNAMTR